MILVAAKVGGIVANNTYRAQFLYENLMIEANVIHAAYKNGVKKLLFLGSSCIYPKLAPQPMPEDALLNSPAAASAIRELADLGLLIYVDDFGGGVSSLTHLRNHPVGGIKLPASLTELVAGDGDDSAQGIVAGLADLAERLGIDRVAKGIAEPGQRALMRDLGWERGQGMLLGEPAPLPPQGLRSLVP